MKCDLGTCICGATSPDSNTIVTQFPPPLWKLHSTPLHSMATLNFTPTRLTPQNPSKPHSPPKPISSISIISHTKPSPSPSPSPSSILHHHYSPKQLHFRTPNSLSESSVSSPPAEVYFKDDANDENLDPTVELRYLDQDIDPESIVDWELDFCSRPILDIRGKKLWELVVCDYSLSLQYTKYFPNNVINSITLKDAIVNISDDLGVPLPQKIRYFRSQMQTIITKACKELGIKPVPSKRCVTLLLWLEERFETVYTRHPGFQKGAKPLLTLDNPFPMELPENLFGEKWAFVQLPYSAVQEEVSSLNTRFVFGAGLDLDLLGIEIDANTMIPGLAVSSSRAQPLAAWMNGLELCSIEADTTRAALILSVGISTRYTYANYKKTPVTTSEAEAWEAAKKACGGLHFLAIQDDLNSDDCVGFWLLLDLPPPPV